jgi:hypothetical protein
LSRRGAPRRRATGAAALAACAGALFCAVALAAPSARAAWGAPFELTKPGALDLIAAQLAFSPNGASAAAFGIQDVDTPGDSHAYVTSRSARGAVGSPLAIGTAQEVIGLSFDGSALELLTGVAPSSLSCCSAVQAVRLTAAGVLQRPRTLVGGLTGPTYGQLLTLGTGGMLAAVATERGVWVVQSARGDRFGSQHRLGPASQIPQSLTSAWLGGASTIVAWTSARGPTGVADPRTIYYAMGSRLRAPTHVKSLLTVPGGHRIDELRVARRGSGATVAWVESWYDRRGYHSEVRAADVVAHPGIRTLAGSAAPASGVDIAADAAGDLAVSWQSCRANGSCTVSAAVRGAKSTFGAYSSFGQVDPGQVPAAAVGPSGQAIVAWIRGGRPMAAVGSARNRRFGATRTLSSRAQFAADIAVAYGPRRQALAAWSQGTLNPSLVGVAYSG